VGESNSSPKEIVVGRVDVDVVSPGSDDNSFT
jgi:hypothetical protein